MENNVYTENNPLRVFTAFSGYDSQCLALERKEIWRDIKGYEGLYQVSNLGRVKRLAGLRMYKNSPSRYFNERILKPKKDKNGYLLVGLSKNGATLKVHRLVANAFIPNPNNYPCINHIDENKENNSVENLEWCTIEYNNRYGTAKIRSGIAHRKPVLMMDKSGLVLKRFEYIKQAEMALGIKGASTMIVRCCKKQIKTAYGYTWKYDGIQ